MNLHGCSKNHQKVKELCFSWITSSFIEKINARTQEEEKYRLEFHEAYGE